MDNQQLLEKIKAHLDRQKKEWDHLIYGLGVLYQSFDKLNIKGKRNTEKRIQEYELEEYLKEKGYNNRVIIVPIKNRYGLTLDKEFDAIVISPETEKTAIQINKERILRGKSQLKIIKVPFVLAEDGKPISSTRINNKEIDENGSLL